VAERKPGFFAKVKDDENFNRKNTTDSRGRRPMTPARIRLDLTVIIFYFNEKYNGYPIN